jgi:hypothetical protein
MAEVKLVRRRTRYPEVTVDRFIAVFKEALRDGHDVNWVSEELGLPKDLVYARASEYRSMGILEKGQKLVRATERPVGFDRTTYVKDLLNLVRTSRF